MADAGAVAYPMNNSICVLQTTNAGGRTAGRMYYFSNDAWVDAEEVWAGASGGATSARKILVKKTGIADATATPVLTVTVPNGNHAAMIMLRMLSSNGSTDAFESARVAEGLIAVTRTTGLATVAAVATLALAQIATVAAGATHTLAYAVSANTGGNTATQTFTVNVTIDDTGNVGGNQILVVAEIVNSEASGVTVAAA